MGGTCGKNNNVEERHIREKRKRLVPPQAIDSILGVEVDRDHAWYQYCLFSLTRLMDKYKMFLYPNVTMSLGSFREDLRDYIQVVSEVYNDMCFEERQMRNGRVDESADALAKAALGQLAYWFWVVSKNPQQTISAEVISDAKTNQNDSRQSLQQQEGVESDDSPKKNQGLGFQDFAVYEEYKKEQDSLSSVEEYKTCYEDTLKLLTTDLERKQIWQLSTLDSNKSFQKHLKEKEPDTYQELLDDSFIIEVPRPLRRKSPSRHSLRLGADGDEEEEEG